MKVVFDELKNKYTEEGFEELYLYSLAQYWLEDIDKKSSPNYKVYDSYEDVRYISEVMEEIVANSLRLYYEFNNTISYNVYVEFCTLYYGEIRFTDIFELFKEYQKEGKK